MVKDFKKASIFQNYTLMDLIFEILFKKFFKIVVKLQQNFNLCV